MQRRKILKLHVLEPGFFKSVEAACDRIVRTDKVYVPNQNEKTEATYHRYIEADEKLYPSGK